jgi:hypothetical protein
LQQASLIVTVKETKKYASTGGWGFLARAGGDASQPCFACHKPQKAQDYTFSTYIS